ncbi:polyphosphate kinase 2 [Microbaculum marinisediminis]|uniref:ADP/GDP-polyphosphate phosphotransferase n=1 Tax=Microbaculum marinisediminis TaxID=2931392 RepID=A0AAW5QU49_9HYPH|nr:polyphosphate kinase 2 [Microbaculum sp. A6E488]MCT8970747.1 polyphosphate kinase 2 [Microbaculum sp. A6E488]
MGKKDANGKSRRKSAKRRFDLDDPDLPEWIDDGALPSGGFPYEERMDRDDYEDQLRLLQIELLKLQAHIRDTETRLVVLFEGRDAAGKGGTISRFTQHLNPRHAHVVALSKPTATEAGEWYFQRYIRRLPTQGDIALFDRSWYNRAGVERVMDFCTPDQTEHFLREVPKLERMLVDDGVTLIKIWLNIGREMQMKRFHKRRHDPLKQWKLSPIDLQAIEKFDSYTLARDELLSRTHTEHAPWTVIRANDKMRTRLNALRVVLSRCPYKEKHVKVVGPPDPKIVLPAPAFLADRGD